MKKKYIAPKSQVIGINLEGMVAASVGFDNSEEMNDKGDVLSERGGWSSDNWSEE